MKRAQSISHKFAEDISKDINGKVGELFTIGAVEEGIRRTIEYGSHIKDLAEDLDVSTDAVQQWDYALRKSGASADAAAKFLEHLSEARKKALGGDFEAISQFHDLGVSTFDLRDNRLEDIGKMVAEKVRTGDVQQLIPALKQIGGKGAVELVAAFKSGLDAEFKKAPIIDEANIKALSELGSGFTDLGKRLMTDFAPFLVAFSNTVLSDIEVRFWAIHKAVEMIVELREKLKLSSTSGAEVGALVGDTDAIDKALKSEDTKLPSPRKNIFEETHGEASQTRTGQSGLTISANSLQQIGAKIAFNPLQTEMQRNTRAIQDATNTIKEYGRTFKRIVPTGFDGQSGDPSRGAMF